MGKYRRGGGAGNRDRCGVSGKDAITYIKINDLRVPLYAG
jgi:hypothetical protein